MHTKARRTAAISASLLSMAVSAVVWSQATAPTTAPASAPATAAAPATGPVTTAPASTKMLMRYENARVDTVLTNMSQVFGFTIVKNVQFSQLITIQNPTPVDADQAIALLNSALLTLGYGTIQSKTDNTPNARTILRVASILEVKKAQIPVHEGADPDQIPLNDEIITQVIPLKNVSAPGLRTDLMQFVSSDADIGANAASNTIFVTDTSAKIHRLAQIIQLLDNQKSIKTVIEYRQLINSNAADAARLINAMFNPANTQGTGAAGGGGGGGGVAAGAPGAGGRGAGGIGGGRGGGGGGGGGGIALTTGRLYADSDPRTNTVVLNGPSDQVAQAVDMLNRIESIPIDLLNTSVFFIKHLRNAQALDVVPVLNNIFGGTTGNIGGGGGVGTSIGRSSTNGLSAGSLGGSSGRGNSLGGTTGRGGATGGAAGGFGGTGGEAGGLGAGGGGGGRGGGGGGGGAGGGFGGAGGGFGGGTAGISSGAGRNTSATGVSAASALAGAAYFVANADTNSILVTTDKTYEERVRGIIDELDRPVPQVMIKVLVCEVTHTNNDEIGFQFGVNDNLRTATDVNGNSITLGLLGGTNFGLSNPANGFQIGLVESQISATLRALASSDKLEVLSRPYILTQDNQEAYMLVGQQVPYITNSQVTNTGQTINSVSYTQVGISLDVISHVNPDGLVTMLIAPQVSQLDVGSGVPIASNVTAPTFTTRQAQCQVAVKNGETIVIGGLMQDQKQQVINKIPVLGDIPYLGMLFKDTINNKVKTELLIFLTPHVAMTPDPLQKMSDEEIQNLKIVPNAVQPGTFEQQMKGMGAGATTTQPQTELRLERGNIVPKQ